MQSFNVLHNPWIPVLTRDGEKELGILETIRQAHELKGVQAQNPLETVAVLRLLTAFLMDAYQSCGKLPHQRARRALYRAGQFDMEVVEDYVKTCAQEGASFNLFDKARPFMQAAYDEKLDAGKDKPIATLVHALPSGNNHVFFDHRFEDEHALTAPQAIRTLLATYLFCTAAAQGYPSSVNNTPCVYAFCLGNTFFETLVFNMVSKAECGTLEYGIPAWRSTIPVIPKEQRARVDLLEGLTFQPRRATLIPGKGEGLITKAYFQQGLDFKGNSNWHDPNVAYVRNAKGIETTVKPRIERALWRDIGALTLSQAGKPPLVIETANEILDNAPIKLQLFLAGLVTDQASYQDTVADDTLSIPLDIVSTPAWGERLRRDMEFIERSAGLLRRALARLSDDVAAQTQALFFQRAHDYVFGDYFSALREVDFEKGYYTFVEAVDKRIWDLLSSVTRKSLIRLGDDGRNLLRQASARNEIYFGYQKMRKEREDGRKTDQPT